MLLQSGLGSLALQRHLMSDPTKPVTEEPSALDASIGRRVSSAFMRAAGMPFVSGCPLVSQSVS